MWTHSTQKPYLTDLTDTQWELLAPLIPDVSPNTTQETIARREIVNGILSRPMIPIRLGDSSMTNQF